MSGSFLDLLNHSDVLMETLVRMNVASAEENIEVTPLAGGVSSSIFKLRISNGRTICVKQALPKLKVKKDWFAPVERVFGEIDWLKTVASISPELVPNVIGIDRETGSFAMEFLPPEENLNWKSELLAGNIDVDFAGKVGEKLSLIHSKTAKNSELANRFNFDDNFYSIRLEPYLTETARVHPDLSAYLLSLLERTQKNKLALVHGDVSPKNILMGLKGPVFIDAECAWYGDPAFDMAFCLNHLLIKSLWNRSKCEVYLSAFTSQCAAYLKNIDWEKPEECEFRIATLLPAFALARVDGKSPAEYLDDTQRDKLRRIAIKLLKKPVNSLQEIKSTWLNEVLS